MNPDDVSKAFVEHYYTTFDSNRAALANLYQEGSMLTFEGQKIQGAQNIVAKLTSLPFQQCQHGITTVDCQPSGPAGGMLVFVSGNLQLSGEQHALKFSQVPLFSTYDLLLIPGCDPLRIFKLSRRVPIDLMLIGQGSLILVFIYCSHFGYIARLHWIGFWFEI